MRVINPDLSTFNNLLVKESISVIFPYRSGTLDTYIYTHTQPMPTNIRKGGGGILESMCPSVNVDQVKMFIYV